MDKQDPHRIESAAVLWAQYQCLKGRSGRVMDFSETDLFQMSRPKPAAPEPGCPVPLNVADRHGDRVLMDAEPEVRSGD
jgi:hypothetical protein